MAWMTSKDRRIDLEQENRFFRDQIQSVQNRYEEKIEELSMIHELGIGLLHENRFEQACRIILDVIIKNTMIQNCSIMLLDRPKETLFLACAVDSAEHSFIIDASKVFSRQELQYTFRLGEGAAGKALLERKPIIVSDAKRSEYFTSDGRSQIQIGSLLSIPLFVDGAPFGVINLSHPDEAVFEKSDRNLFNIISNFVAIAIHRTLVYERLCQSEEKYRVLTENSNDGITIVRDNHHLYANPMYQRLTGYSMTELSQISFLSLFGDDRNKRSLHRIRDFLNAAFDSLHLETGMWGKGRKKVEVDINAASIVQDGQRTCIFSIRDLTVRKELEKQLIHSKKMEAIGTLAGGVAHDLNNILSGLVSYPDLLLMDLSSDSPMRKPILTMKKSGEKAAHIVQDLLTLARRGVEITEIVNLNRVIEEYLKSPEYEKLTFHHPKVTWELHLDEALPHIMGSSIHLSKSIMNLLSNAAESMPKGGMVTISTRPQVIKDALNDNLKDGEYAVLTVSDTGVGISPEEQDKIFEPFYTKKVMGRSGTGLGMAVVWGTIKDHDGHIDIQSVEGSGTKITLYFPATLEASTPAEQPMTQTAYRGNGESILVIDDMEEQREIACRMLTKLNYRVASVASGEEAVEYMKKESADLLVLDMIMEPGMDGLDTYKVILESHPSQKAILISGFSETRLVREAQRLGAGAYIKKPYSLETLALAVRNEFRDI
jgi:PAS domain S-box-containing protein